VTQVVGPLRVTRSKKGEKMNSIEARNIAVVLKYFDGCNSGDLDALLCTLHPDLVHYFLPDTSGLSGAAEHLARLLAKI
jgi:hypothetical protein